MEWSNRSVIEMLRIKGSLSLKQKRSDNALFKILMDHHRSEIKTKAILFFAILSLKKKLLNHGKKINTACTRLMELK